MNVLPQPDILLEQGACIVINKPGGLLTQAPPGIDSLELRTKQFLKKRDAKPGNVYLGVPHRLDRPVSGAIVVVKNVRAAQRLAAQFQNRAVGKVYWAVVEGSVDPATGTWSDWMQKIPGHAKSEIVDPTHPGAQPAVLNYFVRARSPQTTWLQIELGTGRTHQIRLQAASRGHPILGDQLYGAVTTFGPNSPDIRKRWIALHARRLRFQHPIAKTDVDQVAPLPEYWTDLAEFDFV